jgi:WD40 repeat protein
MPDGRTVLSNSWADASIALWDTSVPPPVRPPLFEQARGLAAVSPNGKTLAVGRIGGVTLWSLTTRQAIAELTAKEEDADTFVVGMAFSNDGRRLVTVALLGGGGVFDMRVVDWDLSTHSVRGRIPDKETRRVTAGALAPDGRWGAVARGGSLLFWDLDKQRPLFELKEDQLGTFWSLAFTADGKTLLVGDSEGTVTFWDVVGRRKTAELLHRFGRVETKVAISPDHRTFGVGGDGTISLFDLPTRLPLGQPFRVSEKGWTDLSFSPDGKQFASGGQDGRIMVWNNNVSDWLTRAQAVANRNLSGAEWWQFFGPDVPYRKTFAALPPGEGAKVGVRPGASGSGG